MCFLYHYIFDLDQVQQNQQRFHGDTPYTKGSKKGAAVCAIIYIYIYTDEDVKTKGSTMDIRVHVFENNTSYDLHMCRYVVCGMYRHVFFPLWG